MTWMLVDCDELNTTAGVLRRAAGQLDELTGQIFSACCSCCGTPAVDASIAELGARVRSTVGGVGNQLLAEAAGLDASATVIANDSSLGTAVSAAWGEGLTGGAMPAGLTVSTVGGGPGAGLGLSDLTIGGVNSANLPGGLTQSITGGPGAGDLFGSSPLDLQHTIVNPAGIGPDAQTAAFDLQGQITAAGVWGPYFTAGVPGHSVPDLSGLLGPSPGALIGAMTTSLNRGHDGTILTEREGFAL